MTTLFMTEENLKSSYKTNNFGDVFYAIVRAVKPINCVELGVLHGYSTLFIAKGLKENGRGTVNTYDLFEDYPYNHSNYEDIKKFFQYCPMVKVHKWDANLVWEDYEPGSVDFLHVDLSNCGLTVKMVMDRWDSRMMQGGSILFEGGSQERDEVEWMKKYNRASLKAELETNPIIEEKYIFGTYLKYPSLTHLLKKR